MKKITDKTTGETFMGEVWIAEVKDGKRELKVELKTEDDVDRYEIEKQYGGEVPKVGDAFWFIKCDGSIIESSWDGWEYDKTRFESGSAFWTREEAEKELKRRKAYVVLKEDTKGFKPDWEKGSGKKWYVLYLHDAGKFILDWRVAYDDGGKLYFATVDDAEASIKTHRQEWLDYLGVEQ